MKKIGIYSVSDDYIDFLRNDKLLSNVYDNKKNHRTHTRKYIGPVFQKDGLKFYIPLSSPKNNDYEIINNKKVIRGDYPFIIRLVNFSVNKGQELLGTLRLTNMIPVPDSELQYYDLNKEADLQYKDIIRDEYKSIVDKSNDIYRFSNKIYYDKTNAKVRFTDKNKNPPKYLSDTINFKYAEKKCDEYIKLKRLKEIRQFYRENAVELIYPASSSELVDKIIKATRSLKQDLPDGRIKVAVHKEDMNILRSLEQKHGYTYKLHIRK